MPEEPKPTESEEAEDEEQALEKRFPVAPQVRELPEVPKFEANLPPRRVSYAKNAPVVAGTYRKAAIAYTAATSFIAPIILLSLLGWWLDTKLKHTVAWMAFLGVLIGMAVGISSLIKVMGQLEDENADNNPKK